MGKNRRKKQSTFQKELPVNICRFSFVDGALIEIIGNVHEFYLVQFIDTANNEVVHQGEIQNNQWIRTSRSYFTKWKINIFRKSDNALVFSHVYDCEDQRVYIALESRALGDTMAWLHSVEEFREKHACQMVCSTFMNDLFAEKYPDIEFVEPGVVVMICMPCTVSDGFMMPMAISITTRMSGIFANSLWEKPPPIFSV